MLSISQMLTMNESLSSHGPCVLESEPLTYHIEKFVVTPDVSTIVESQQWDLKQDLPEEKPINQSCDNKICDKLGNSQENLGPYECSTCNLTFQTKLRLRNHKRCHNLHYACFVCNKFFSSRINLDIHLNSRVHASQKRFHCGHCQKRFTLKIYLQRHKLRHLLNGALIKCQDCWKKFFRISDLLLHRKIHKKPIECTLCSRSFRTQFLFDNHRCGRKHQCLCKKIFPTEESLRLHRTTHVSDKPYKCSMCLKTFTTNRYLTSHMKLHPGIHGALECDICFKSFQKMSCLTTHKKTHKIVKCDICNEVFNQRMDLLLHRKTHKKSFPCNICGKSYRRSSCLSRHKRIHSNQTLLQCSKCDEYCRSDRDLKKHETRVHPTKTLHSCDTCAKSFPCERDLHLHIKVHNIKHELSDESPGLLGYLN